MLRYRTDETDDGLRGREGTFLVCSFWLADALCMIGRIDEAQALFERLLAPQRSRTACRRVRSAGWAAAR